jgi:hypothetical protein
MKQEAALRWAAVGVAALLSVAFATASQAQNSTRTGSLTPTAIENVPGSVVDTSLRDDEQSQRSISDYIGQPLPDREQVLGRGQSLMYEMQRRNASAAAIERVRETTRRNACAGIIINADFDRDYLPPRTTMAFDLQPQNGVLARGFTPITMGDQRVAAFGGVVRNPTQPVIGDALLGISQFFTPLANGRYRVVLFTDKLGEQAARLPFGRTITANNMPVMIADLPPPRWLVQGYLTNKAVSPGLASAGSAPGGVALLSTNDLMTDQGGAIELEVDVATGGLRLGFSPAAALSAIIIEPADQRSSLQLIGAARNGPALINDCFDFERRIGRDVARGSPFLGGPNPQNPGGPSGPQGSPN